MSESPEQGLFRWLWHAYMARHIWVILLALLFMTIEGSMLGAMSYIMKPMFDQVFVGGDTDAALFVGLLILGYFPFAPPRPALRKKSCLQGFQKLRPPISAQI